MCRFKYSFIVVLLDEFSLEGLSRIKFTGLPNASFDSPSLSLSEESMM